MAKLLKSWSYLGFGCILPQTICMAHSNLSSCHSTALKLHTLHLLQHTIRSVSIWTMTYFCPLRITMDLKLSNQPHLDYCNMRFTGISTKTIINHTKRSARILPILLKLYWLTTSTTYSLIFYIASSCIQGNGDLEPIPGNSGAHTAIYTMDGVPNNCRAQTHSCAEKS